MNQESSPNAKEEKRTLRSTVLGLVAMYVMLLLVLYAIVMFYPEAEQEEDCSTGHVSTWGNVHVINSTAVYIDFGKLTPEPKPTDLEIGLVMNGTDEGEYSFQGNDDGPLAHVGGFNLGTLLYDDIEDNQLVNLCDRLEITELYPDSVYTVKMYWIPSGDQIGSKTFSMPKG